MATPVSHPPVSNSSSPDIEVTDPFDDESGVHDISVPTSARSEVETEPPPSGIEVRPVANGMPGRIGGETDAQRPTPVCPVPTFRDVPSPATAAVVARIRRAPDEGETQPAPDSDSAAEIYKDMAQSGALRPLSLPDPAAATNAPDPVPNLDLACARMKDCFADGDYDACLETAARILITQPDHAGALSYARTCQRLIEQRHSERIGDLTAVPYVAVTADQMRWLALDHREGFLLSLIDGKTSIDELCDIAGMNRVDVLKTLAGLIEAEVLRLR